MTNKATIRFLKKISVFLFGCHVMPIIYTYEAQYARAESVNLGIFDEKKPLETGGLSSLEGSSGGGLASWATIGGYGSKKGLGTAFHYTYVRVSDYQDQNVGGLLGIYNRVEISYSHNFGQTGITGRKLGVGKGYQFDMDIVGVKARILGDLVSPDFIPQVAVGAMYKHATGQRVIHGVGGKSTDGVDTYIAVTKLFSQVNIILDTTVRFTKANQMGILGFGGDRHNSYYAQFEGSIGYLPPFVPGLIVGGEYRTKPNNMSFSKESNWADVFATYFLNKHLNLTVAYVSLGTVADFRHQRGVYASLQTGF